MDLDIYKKSNSATISDLRQINIFFEMVRSRESKIHYCPIGEKEIVAVGDTSYKSDDKSVGGALLFLTNKSMRNVSPP